MRRDEGDPVFRNGVTKHVLNLCVIWNPGSSGERLISGEVTRKHLSRLESIYAVAGDSRYCFFNTPDKVRHFIPSQHDFFNRATFINLSNRRRQEQAIVYLIAASQVVHGPFLPVHLLSQSRGTDQRLNTEHVANDDALDSGKRTNFKVIRNDGPIVAINHAEHREQQQGDVGGRSTEAAKIRSSIFQLPPWNIRHSGDFNLGWKKSNRCGLYSIIRRKLSIRFV